jgi:MoxR-like ATPase
VEATRTASSFINGVSTRGAIALYKAAQVTAALNGRDYVIPEDVKYVAPHVLVHRLSAGSSKGGAAAGFLEDVLKKVRVPLETV